jgi:uncharacterized protein YndB with AHSA1/START domain
MKYSTTAERTSERESVVTRIFNGSARIVFEAWTKPELLQRWWAPKSYGVYFLSCEMDVHTGGMYRFVFGHAASEKPMEFFGRTSKWRLTRAWCGQMRKVVKVGLSPR